MKKLIEKVSLKIIIIFLLFYILMFFIINISNLGVPKLLQITGGTNILDFKFGYTVEEAYILFDNLGSDGRDFYLKHILPIDFVFPASYMLFYFSVIAYNLKKQIIKGQIFEILLLAPILAMLFDWAENIAIILMLSNYPDVLATTCKIGSVFTIIKFVFIILSVTLTVTLLFLLSFRFIRKKFFNQ